MRRYITLCLVKLAMVQLIFEVTGSHKENDFELYPFKPTKGAVWPKPQKETKGKAVYEFEFRSLNITISNKNCDLIKNALDRFKTAITKLENIVKRHRRPRLRGRFVTQDSKVPNQGKLESLDINLSAPCEIKPYMGMNETYKLTVKDNKCTIKSSSVWGIMRGLDSFQQLIYFTDDYKHLRISATKIVDYPRYEHRGLLIDTARHYLSLDTIFILLEGMAVNKLNVLHLHIVDDQAFPYVSERFPDLSKKGAYYPSLVYTRQHLEKIMDHATNRGIRVIPEFDMPGHTRSWGYGYPNILTICQNGYKGLGILNPIIEETYKFIKDLFQELHTIFTDEYFHIGGDEVDFDCWLFNEDIREYMMRHNITHVRDLHAMFMDRTVPLLKKKVIVWQEIFDENITLARDSLVQVWLDSGKKMEEILLANHKVLYSTNWYLDHLDLDVRAMYTSDPRYMVRPQLAAGIVGGEACMWGEMVDDTNVVSRVFPRASAVAEVLWSTLPLAAMPNTVYNRLEEHTCRMRRRGVQASPPVGPGHCVL